LRQGVELRKDVSLRTSGEKQFNIAFTVRERHIFKEQGDYENSRLLTELQGSKTGEAHFLTERFQ